MASRIDALRDQLLSAQFQLIREKSFAVAIIVTGMPTAGRSEVVNTLLEWMDPKHILVHALDRLRQADGAKPPMYRYWLTLPSRGEIAICFTGWYEDLFSPALHAPKRARRTEARVIERIQRLEAMLTCDRIRIVKLDLRVERKLQKKRVAALRADNATRWRVTDEDRWLAKHHALARKVADRAIAATDTPYAKWHIVDGADPQARLLEAGTHVLRALIDKSAPAPARAARAATRSKKRMKPFRTHPTTTLSDEAYETELATLQRRLALLSRKGKFAKRGVVLALEGMDAAGKGGSIRRLTAALDARQYTVVPISAPTPEEFSRPYLWRFWRRLPDRGDFTIFDRSWYGRVLVERVRELASAADWQRAYEEINEFELQLAESGLIVQKFWLALGKDEQLKRFQAREADALKRFKVDREDWANRRLFASYQSAAAEMIERTDTKYAPWTVVEADDKKHARLKVLRTVCERIELALK